MHTEFEQKAPMPSMFSHVNKVPEEIFKWIIKIIIKTAIFMILESGDKQNLC